MKYVRMFSDTDTALYSLSQALEQDNWQDFFLTDQNGERTALFHSKKFVEDLNSITPSGGFYSTEQAEKLLHELLLDSVNEIAEWLVNGNNKPMKIRHTSMREPVGYSFDKFSQEQSEYKLQLILRRELKEDDTHDNKTMLGIFVSTFKPVPEF